MDGKWYAKHFADYLWPVAGSVLALIAMPVAMAQYPRFFNENEWLLPVSVGVVVFCWVLPLLLHSRARRLYAAISAKGKFGKVALVAVSAIAISILWFGSQSLLRRHRNHLQALNTPNSAQQAPKLSVSESAPSHPTSTVATFSRKNERNASKSSAPIQTGHRQITSIIQNDGKMGNVDVSGGEVAGTPTGDAFAVHNLQGAEMGDVRATNVRVSNSSPFPSRPHAVYKVLPGATGGVISNNLSCGADTLIETEGGGGTLTAPGNKMNDARLCDWLAFMNEAEDHREDIVGLMEQCTDTITKEWVNLPATVEQQYLAELETIRATLVNASGDQTTFYGATGQLRRTPPSFDMDCLNHLNN